MFCEILESSLQLTQLADCLTDWFSKVHYSWLSWLTVWLTAVFLLSSVVFSNVHSGWLNWLADWVHSLGPLDYLPPNSSPCSIRLSTFLSAGDFKYPFIDAQRCFCRTWRQKWERIHLLLCWVRKKSSLYFPVLFCLNRFKKLRNWFALNVLLFLFWNVLDSWMFACVIFQT